MTTAVAVHPDLDSARQNAADAGWAYVPDFGVIGELFAPRSVARTIDTVVGVAARTFGCPGAGVILIADGSTAATAASTATARRADALQVEHHQGPGFDAITGRQPVLATELRFDSRWRFWAPQAADQGFRSALSLVLVDGDPFGALTLYSPHPTFFRAESLRPGLRFAEQASIAIAVAVEREQLHRARDSRGIIGQAQGILMERYNITAERAFAVLKRYSSHSNQKLRLVAERVVRERSVPGL